MLGTFRKYITINILPVYFPSQDQMESSSIPTALINRALSRDLYLGGGSFGDVYLLPDAISRTIMPSHKRKVVKRIAKYSTGRDQFMSEVATLNLLSTVGSSFAPEFYGSKEDSVQYYIIMEYIEGKSLCEWLISVHPEVLNESVYNITRELMKIVFAIRKYNLFHRDIKPDNVIISGSYDDPKVTLLDWGISCVQEGATPGVAGPRVATPRSKGAAPPGVLPCAGTAGTRLFMAPEVGTQKDFDPTAADLWSIGRTIDSCEITRDLARSKGSLTDIIIGALVVLNPITRLQNALNLARSMNLFVRFDVARAMEDVPTTPSLLSEAAPSLPTPPITERIYGILSGLSEEELELVDVDEEIDDIYRQMTGLLSAAPEDVHVTVKGMMGL